MDDKSLEDLKTTFESAPSAALARIILLELVGRGDVADVGPYLDGAGDELTVADTITVARALAEAGDVEMARPLYQSAVARDPGAQDEDLNELLNIHPSDSAEETRERLRVIEKPDPAEVVNLDRYRAETTDFSDVVGLEDIKKQVSKKIILPFQKPSLFARFRKKIGGGVLLFGPPGCGKTLLARATAGEVNASFFNIEISDVLDMWMGESERKLHAIFEKARSETPSVLFFDEIEALAGKREHARSSAASNVISQLLTELDGFAQNNEGVLVLASTNTPWAVDPAFLRPGRFDRMFFVPPPDKVARAGILEHHMKKRPTTGDIDFKLLAAKTPGYSGADLANLVEMAADEAIDESIEGGQEVPISLEHFKAAIGESRSTTVEWLTTARNYARYANDGGRYNDVLDFLKKHGK